MPRAPNQQATTFGVIIPDCQLPKFTEKAHKIAQNTKLRIKCPKIVCGWVGVRRGGKRGWSRENGGSAMVVWGIDAPAMQVSWTISQAER